MASRLLVFAVLVLSGAGLLGSRSVTGQTSDPPTVAEHEGQMKEIRPAFVALRDSLEGQNAEEAATQAATLVELFASVEAFWTAHEIEDATGFARTAGMAASSIASAAEGKDFTAAGDGAKTLGGQCRACHEGYREELPDGSYRLKPGTVE